MSIARNTRKTLIEKRSIDYVPPSERHGKVWHQGPFWFSGNFVLTTFVLGFVGPSVGLTVGWTILSATLGVIVGTFFMAFHANQGPKLGMPQMIQSRAQFGSRGALLPLVATVFVYVGFIVFGFVLITASLNTVIPGDKYLWYPILAVLATFIAVVGYDLLHLIQRWNAIIMVTAFGIFTVLAVLQYQGAEPLVEGSFSVGGFAAMFSIAAGYQISYAVYVSDYSRYLPENTPSRKVVGWTFAGAAFSAIWLMALGAFLASHLPQPDAVGSLVEVGNGAIPFFGTVLILISVPSQIGIMSVNAYGAMLTSATAVDGFTRVRTGRRTRIIGISAIMAVSVVIALLIPEDYLSSFNNFVLLMLYFLIPWTAVNLVDFYFVRRGHYAILEIFDPAGHYGRWSWRGLTAYLIGLFAMIPFMNVSFYTGPIASALGGVDLSFVVGLVVAGALYLVLGRGIDRADEDEMIARSRAELAEVFGPKLSGNGSRDAQAL